MSIQDEINSRELVLQNLVSGESGQVSYLLLPEKGRNNGEGKVDVATKTQPNVSVPTTEYEDADNEASETDFPQWNKERLSSQDSWEEKDTSRSSGSSWEDARSDDTTADSGNCDSPSYDSDGLRSLENVRSGTDHGRTDGLKKKVRTDKGADSSSINSTTDSALSSMISSENKLVNYSNEKFKTLTKKRIPSWRNSSIDVNTSGARVPVASLHNDSPLGGELSCEDDNAPFCNSEYIRKIRKHSRMFSPDTKILETSERIFRSASIRLRNQEQKLKRTQSLKTVETLV